MRLTEDRISHISHIIVDGIWKDDLVDFTDDDEVLREIKKVLSDYLMVEDAADETARNKIRSMSRQIPEGSREWEVLYKKFYQEEIEKKRF
ncbi:MAG: hypothetical protein A2073_01940 [Deltaproteobacteria bacterium GWC2_42_11]|nr:MAG: hypothetical protein A2073_01940 [Deltaproteobacteria bacterium GWC2_42_11]HBO84891.1 DUF507 domain-containing protein [Deltaproteobacteria bacterium]